MTGCGGLLAGWNMPGGVVLDGGLMFGPGRRELYNKRTLADVWLGAGWMHWRALG